MREIILKQAEIAELFADILARGGTFSFRAHGSSMSPFIRNGDILFIEPVEAAALKVGDVALFQSIGDRLIAHRVVSKNIKRNRVVLTMRGDAVSAFCELATPDQVLGRIAVVRRGSKIIRPDRGIPGLAARLWMRLSPAGPLLIQLIRFGKRGGGCVLRRLQSLKSYRIFIRKMVGKKVRYRIATTEDSILLEKIYGHTISSNPGNLVEKHACGTENKKVQSFTLIATVGQKFAGATFLMQFPENQGHFPGLWFFGMRVLTLYRGIGIGEGLVRMGLKTASENSAAKVNLLIFEHNKPGVNLYRKMGFQSDSIHGLDDLLDKEVRQGERRRIIMSKHLLIKA